MTESTTEPFHFEKRLSPEKDVITIVCAGEFRFDSLEKKLVVCSFLVQHLVTRFIIFESQMYASVTSLNKITSATK